MIYQIGFEKHRNMNVVEGALALGIQNHFNVSKIKLKIVYILITKQYIN